MEKYEIIRPRHFTKTARVWTHNVRRLLMFAQRNYVMLIGYCSLGIAYYQLANAYALLLHIAHFVLNIAHSVVRTVCCLLRVFFYFFGQEA